MFQDDENWEYLTQQDENVCPDCRSFEHEWVGSEVGSFFTERWRTGQITVYPNVHDMQDYTHLKGDCRCNLTWRDYLELLATRLFDEFAGVI